MGGWLDGWMDGWMDGRKNREPSMCSLELAVELTLFNLQS